MYLGVDGGGTKTAFTVIDQTGRVLAEHKEKTCYYLEIGLDTARDILQQGVVTTMAKIGKGPEDVRFAFFGLPAYGEDSELLSTLDALPSSFLSPDSYRCDNDMVNGWAAAFDCQDGINIVSGTGSIAYGVKRGKTARCGGWGELFGDEGSGYWIGRELLMAFSKMSDGRMARGPLYEIMKTSLNIKHDLDISALVHNSWKGERSQIASVSTVLSEAAVASDTAALDIFDRAAKELALIVEGTKQALDYRPHEPITVSYSGGVFSAEQWLLPPFQQALNQYSSNYLIQKPAFSPAIGAARYARFLSAGK